MVFIMGKHSLVRYHKFKNSRSSLVKQEMDNMREKTYGLIFRGLSYERVGDVKRYQKYVRKMVDERRIEILNSKKMSHFEKAERLKGLRYLNSDNEKIFKTDIKYRKKHKGYWR